MKNGTIRNKLNYLINKEKGVYTIEEIIDFFDKDSIFALLFIITLPTSVIVIPHGFGAETMFGGSIVILLSIQLIMGFNKPILPKFVTNKKINLGALKNNKYYNKVDKLLLTLESYFKKRYTFVFHDLIVKIIAVLMIIPGVLMFIPLVFTNLFPSISITLISFAFLFKDGLMFLLASFFTFLVSLVYILFFNFIVKMGKKYADKFFGRTRGKNSKRKNSKKIKKNKKK